jgi:hypothetical protein
VWLHCTKIGCTHYAPAAMAPFVIRWGADTSSDVLRQRARCTRCGHKGAVTQRPGYEMGWLRLFSPFPIERA